jgi:hypothetical protein
MLGGRVLLRTMHPFLASELGERFRLEETLQFLENPLRGRGRFRRLWQKFHVRRSIDIGSRIRDNHSENGIYERFPLQSDIVIVLW